MMLTKLPKEVNSYLVFHLFIKGSATFYENCMLTLFFLLPVYLAFYHQTACLSQLCYNFGVDNYHREQYEECVTWLK